MCFLTERQKRTLWGRERMGIINHVEKSTDNEGLVFTLEDVLSLYLEKKDSGSI